MSEEMAASECTNPRLTSTRARDREGGAPFKMTAAKVNRTLGVAPTLDYLWQWGAEAEVSLAEDAATFETACGDAGFSPSQIRTLVGALAAAKTAPWDKWLQGLGIPSIAKELARSIAAHLNLQPDDLMHLPERLVTIKAGEIDGLARNI